MSRAELAKLLRVSEANLDRRIVAARLGIACGRCGGCGNYSYNAQDGSRCYGCGGYGNVAPKSAAQLLEVSARAAAWVEAGLLDEYLAAIRGRQLAKSARKAVLGAWSAKSAGRDYGADWRNPSAPFNSRMHRAHEIVSKALMAIEAMKDRQLRNAAYAVLPELVKAALAEIEAAEADYLEIRQ